MLLSTIPQDVQSFQGLTRAEEASERAWIDAVVRQCLADAGMPNVNIRVEFAGARGRTKPGAKFSSRMGDARVTDYRTRTGRVRLSRTALWRRASAIKRRNTLKHEIAHVLAQLEAGPLKQVGHGPGWKRMMVRLGEEPKRCHSVNRDGLRRRRGRRGPVILRPRPVARPAPVVRPVSIPAGVVVSFRLYGESGSASVVSQEGTTLRLKVHGDHGQAFFGRYVTVDAACVRA